MIKVPLTRFGAEQLKAELQQLKSVARPEVIAAIAEARSHGDLSENAEYDAAKERQGFIEGRIAELEGKLSNAQVIDPADLDDAIREMIEYDGPFILDVLVERHENCFPMIPSGKPHNEMLLGEASTEGAITGAGGALV